MILISTVVKSLAMFWQIGEPVVVTGVVPGSFYERLFPSGSVLLFCSSSSLHWLSKGVIDKAKLDSLYIPVYGPSDEELREIIQEEGSFSIAEMQVHDPTSGMDSVLLTPNRMVNGLRAAFEPTIVQHFGSSGEVMDEFVRTGGKHLSLFCSSQVKHTKNPRVMLVVSLTKA